MTTTTRNRKTPNENPKGGVQKPKGEPEASSDLLMPTLGEPVVNLDDPFTTIGAIQPHESTLQNEAVALFHNCRTMRCWLGE